MKVKFLLIVMLSYCNVVFSNDTHIISTRENTTPAWLDYTGDQQVVLDMIEKLKHYHYADSSYFGDLPVHLKWDEAITKLIIGDTLMNLIVPAVDHNDVLTDYMKIKMTYNKEKIYYVEKVNYQHDYINNTNRYEKGVIGMELNALLSAGTKLQDNFSASEASQLFTAEWKKKSKGIRTKKTASDPDYCSTTYMVSMFVTFNSVCTSYEDFNQGMQVKIDAHLFNMCQLMGGNGWVDWRSSSPGLGFAEFTVSYNMLQFLPWVLEDALDEYADPIGRECLFSWGYFQGDGDCEVDSVE